VAYIAFNLHRFEWLSKVWIFPQSGNIGNEVFWNINIFHTIGLNGILSFQMVVADISKINEQKQLDSINTRTF